MDSPQAVAGIIFPDPHSEDRVLKNMTSGSDIAKRLKRRNSQFLHRYNPRIHNKMVYRCDLLIPGEEAENVSRANTRRAKGKVTTFLAAHSVTPFNFVIPAKRKQVAENPPIHQV